MEIERNTQGTVELIERADGKHEIAGYGAVYYDGTPGSEYDLGGGLFERFSPGCFDRCIAERQNVQIRYNHSGDWILGDVEGGAVVRCDQKGLRYSLPYDPEDPQHLAVRCKLQKGLIRGSSIGAAKPEYEFREESGKHIALVRSVKMIRDVGPVNDPAYKGASAMCRSADLDNQYNDWLRKKAETEKRLKRLHKNG
jgi:HK97 family phage prohead protease